MSDKPFVYETKEAGAAFPDFKAFDDEAPSAQTGFGRNAEMHGDAIRYLLRLKQSGHIPQDGFHVLFPAVSVGCEAFYFAMCAKEAGLTEGKGITVHASDIEEEFVKYADQIAQYSPDALAGLPDNLRPYFFAVADSDKMEVSPEIRKLVVFETPGDIRKSELKRQFDIVALPHVIYHYHKDAEKREILQAVLNMSRGMVITDYLSFAENRHLFESILTPEFAGVSREMKAVPLQVIRQHSWLERYMPFIKKGPITNLEGMKERGYFAAIRLQPH